MGRHERRAELSEFKRKVSGVVTYLVDAAGRVTGRIGGRFEFMRRRKQRRAVAVYILQTRPRCMFGS